MEKFYSLLTEATSLQTKSQTIKAIREETSKPACTSSHPSLCTQKPESSPKQPKKEFHSKAPIFTVIPSPAHLAPNNSPTPESERFSIAMATRFSMVKAFSRAKV